jgi:O-antigen/teichoic acid export membrane protein
METKSDSDEGDIHPLHSEPTVRALARNAMWNLVRLGIGWGSLLLLPPLLVHVMDKPSYATWMLILQMGAYLTLVDGGLQISVARFVARASGLRDKAYLEEVVSCTALVLCLTAIATLCLTLFASWQSPHLFPGIPESLRAEFRNSVLIIGVSLAISMPFSIIAGFFQGLQRNEVSTLAISIGKGIGAMGTAWAAYHRQGVVAMTLWVAGGNLIQSLLLVIGGAHAGMLRLVRSSRVAGKMVWEFILFCSAMLASQCGSLLITGLDLPVVAAFDFRSAGYYAVAATISNMLIAPHGAIVMTIMPLAASMGTDNAPQRLGQVLCKTTRYATALLCGIAALVVLTMQMFLPMWVGPDYGSHALPLALGLILAQVTRLTMLPYAMIGFAAGQQQRMLMSPMIEGSVNLVVSLIGVRVFGAMGVVAGTLIGAIVGVWLHFAISIPATDAITVSRRSLFWQGLFKPIACVVPAVAIALMAVQWTTSIFERVAVVTLTGITVLFLLGAANFSKPELLQMRRLFSFPELCAKSAKV